MLIYFHYVIIIGAIQKLYNVENKEAIEDENENSPDEKSEKASNFKRMSLRS